MLYLQIKRRKLKFHSFTEIHKWLLEHREYLTIEQFNEAIDSSISMLNSINYEQDFVNYYKNLLNSLKNDKKDLINK